MLGALTEDILPRDEEVVLTFFRLSDAAALSDMDADPEHRRRFEFPEEFVPSLGHSEKVIAGWTHAREDGQFVFAVRALGNGDLLGGCEIRLRGNHAANLSYWTFPRHRGHGVASRAVALACQIARAQLEVQRVEIVVDPDNIASRRVALRNGFREAGMRERRILHVKDMSALRVGVERGITQRPATIETERLYLVALLPSEIEALVDCDTEQAGILAGVRFPRGWPEDREAREGLPWHLRHLVADPAHIPWRVRVVVERVSGTVVGAINLKGPPSSSGDVEIGWGVVEARRRRGYAVEAAAALIAWALAQPVVTTVSATVSNDNPTSQRVAAKLGMVRTSDTRRKLPLWLYQRI